MQPDPTYKHDCDACRFLGSVTGPDPYHAKIVKTWDLYVCGEQLRERERALGLTVLARYSDEPSNYKSCPLSMVRDVHPVLLWGRALLELEVRELEREVREKSNSGTAISTSRLEPA